MATIIRMVNHTRLDCLLGSTSSMRWGLAQAVHHARHRSAFGKLLAEQPAMQNVLADLAVESEAATVTAFRIARSYDEDDPAFRRFATAVAKYWVCKRAAPHAAEALETLGGNGYVEESGHAAAAARRPAQLDLGGLGQRRGAGRAARDGQGARGAAGLHGRVRARRAAATRCSTPTSIASRRPARRPSPSCRPARSSRTWRLRSRRACWCATRRRRWPTRSAPAGSARADAPSGRCRRRWTPRRSWTGRWRPRRPALGRTGRRRSSPASAPARPARTATRPGSTRR